MRPLPILSLRVVWTLGCLLLVTPACAQAQSRASQVLVAARAQFEEELKPDSARRLLGLVLDGRVVATPLERAIAYVLFGAIELDSDRQGAARQAFREALALEPELLVDTLRDLSPDLVRVFGDESSQLLRLEIALPGDTVVSPLDGRWVIGVQPSHRALVTATLRDSSSGAGVVHVIRADSANVLGVAAFRWELRLPDGNPISPGRYTLRLIARDSTGAATKPIDRKVLLEREIVDTQPTPQQLNSSAFVPETSTVRERQMSALLRGLAFGVAAGALAGAGPGGASGSDGRAYVAAGALTVGGLVGFLSGRNVMRAIPANVEHNRQLREQDARRRRDIAGANAQAREGARIRIRVVEVSP